ncbi:hypothetical protein E2320_001162 [Naja naja]|nr:hypothetical protein E2320_001162 [Naja naja]
MPASLLRAYFNLKWLEDRKRQFKVRGGRRKKGGRQHELSSCALVSAESQKMAASFKERSAELHENITNFLGTREFLLLDAWFHIKSKVEEIVLVLMPWRALVVMAKLPLKVQVCFSFLAVQLIKMREAKKRSPSERLSQLACENSRDDRFLGRSVERKSLRDIALCVASLSFNQWFTKLNCKDFKLNQVILDEILLVLRKSVTLEELELENCGLKCDFAQQMALVLQEYPDSALNSLNLSRNLLEDRGIIALSQIFDQGNKGYQSLNFARTSVTQKGIMALCQSFVNNGQFRTCLSHLDLSGNPGSLLAEGGNLFGALAGGCCVNLTHLNLCKNVYSHKKSRGDPFAIGQFFSQASALQQVSMSGTKLPPEALSFASGFSQQHQLKNLHLDLSSCELRSEGAQVIQDLISDATSIHDLNLSDNGFDSDMVTLVLSLNRSKSMKHVALGKNFNIQSRETLVDTLHRIVQLTQDEDCSVESVSVAESRLKLRTGILLDGLGSSSHLVALDISGNAMGDLGAKILAKTLSVNKTLRTLMWDRNNTTLCGFLDVISALERNFILTKMPLPMNDIAVAYRSHPEKMEEIVHQIQSYLARNQIQANLPKETSQLQIDSQASSSEQAVKHACQTVQRYIGLLSCVQDLEVKADLLWAEEAIKDATLFMDAVVQSQLDATQSLHPQILQKTDILKQLFCNASETTFLDQLLTEVYDKVAAQWRHACSLSLLPTPSSNGLSEQALKVGAEDNKIGSPQPELSLSRASAKSRPASTKDAKPGSGLLPRTEPASAASLMDLPTAGEKLEHYTRDRPRPNRRNRQPPSKSNVRAFLLRGGGQGRVAGGRGLYFYLHLGWCTLSEGEAMLLAAATAATLVQGEGTEQQLFGYAPIQLGHWPSLRRGQAS